jgi:hypothetical protein
MYSAEVLASFRWSFLEYFIVACGIGCRASQWNRSHHEPLNSQFESSRFGTNRITGRLNTFEYLDSTAVLLPCHHGPCGRPLVIEVVAVHVLSSVGLAPWTFRHHSCKYNTTLLILLEGR